MFLIVKVFVISVQSSTFNLPINALSLYLFVNFSIKGDIALHGEHQSAKKSIIIQHEMHFPKKVKIMMKILNFNSFYFLDHLKTHFSFI